MSKGFGVWKRYPPCFRSSPPIMPIKCYKYHLNLNYKIRFLYCLKIIIVPQLCLLILDHNLKTKNLYLFNVTKSLWLSIVFCRA